MSATPSSPPRNMMQAKSPERVPEPPESAQNLYQANVKHGKKKKFSLKGFIMGESKKERQQRAKTEKGVDTEAQTVYQVAVDDKTGSITSAGTSKVSERTADKAAQGFLQGGKKTYMLKVVLLLMDPDTRRFELLQLEFDSDKALVSDVLTQIPVAVTEEVLSKQKYVGICDNSGGEMSSSVLLSEFCKGNDVLVAVPSGVPSSECARLARPILNDDKVISMLKASGIDASNWQTKNASSSSPTSTSRELPTISDTTVESDSEPDSGSGGLFFVILLVLAAVILQIYHQKITAPIARGQVLAPGGWVSSCGLLAPLASCENSYLKMGQDGVLALYNPGGEIGWKMEGGVCSGDDGCIDGLEMTEDGYLRVGGKRINWVNVKKDAEPLAPWPFAEEPQLRVFHARK